MWIVEIWKFIQGMTTLETFIFGCKLAIFLLPAMFVWQVIIRFLNWVISK